MLPNFKDILIVGHQYQKIMALVLLEDSQQSLEEYASPEELMKRRRKDQERHHSKQIWTKQPHGGPYLKVMCEQKLMLSALAKLRYQYDELPVIKEP